MNCSEVRPLLDLLCDGVLATKESAMVLDHLRTCGQCEPEWRDLEQLRTRFLEAKKKVQVPPHLMKNISEQVSLLERENQKVFLKKWIPPALVATAALAIAGFVAFPWLGLNQSSHLSYSTAEGARKAVEELAQLALPGQAESASVEALVQNFNTNGPVEVVSDRAQLAGKLGYEPKNVRLSSFRLLRSSVWRSKAVAVARYDFVSIPHCGHARQDALTCYQAPAGAIKTAWTLAKDLNGKRVMLGRRRDLAYALWTQDGRDYLFVTHMPMPWLEQVVSGV
jgi:hypothetical protein